MKWLLGLGFLFSLNASAQTIDQSIRQICESRAKKAQCEEQLQVQFIDFTATDKKVLAKVQKSSSGIKVIVGEKSFHIEIIDLMSGQVAVGGQQFQVNPFEDPVKNFKKLVQVLKNQDRAKKSAWSEFLIREAYAGSNYYFHQVAGLATMAHLESQQKENCDKAKAQVESSSWLGIFTRGRGNVAAYVTGDRSLSERRVSTEKGARNNVYVGFTDNKKKAEEEIRYIFSKNFVSALKDCCANKACEQDINNISPLLDGEGNSMSAPAFEKAGTR